MQPEEAQTQTILDGRYQLGECIGEGGMARVHRGEDVALGRTVAIKVLRPGAEGLATPGRARAEMTVLASLSHPSLVTLFDARIAPGRPDYLVMEFVDGPTLSEKLEQGPLPAAEVAQLGAELGEALHVVHSEGIVHRDLKPSNVLLAPAHRPGRAYRSKLADFGIAYLLGSDRTTTPGMVVGTAGYLAPEQVRGSAPAPSADIYSLGLVLLEALTGERAFAPATGMEALVARLTAAPAIPDSVGPGWAALLRDMTATDPDARPTAIEVSTVAAHLADDEPDDDTADAGRGVEPEPAAATPERLTLPIPVVPVLPPESFPVHVAEVDSDRPRSRRTRRVALVGAGAAAVTVVAATAFWLAGTGAGLPDPAGTAPAITEPSPAPTVESDQTVVTDEDASTEPAVVPVDDGTTPVDDDTAPVDQGTAPVDQAPAPADDGAAVDDGGDAEADAAAEVERKAAEAVQRQAEQAAQQAAEKAQRDAERAAELAEAERLREEAKKNP